MNFMARLQTNRFEEPPQSRMNNTSLSFEATNN